jgi:hypothetical protein
MADIIQLRRDTAANWTTADPTLADGEMGLETDTGKIKIGDGATAWSSLVYRFESSAVKLDDLLAPDDNTDLDATTSVHGLMPKAVAPAAGSLNAYGLANGETSPSNKTIFEGCLKIAVVASLPGTPNADTLYFVTG